MSVSCESQWRFTVKPEREKKVKIPGQLEHKTYVVVKWTGNVCIIHYSRHQSQRFSPSRISAFWFYTEVSTETALTVESSSTCSPRKDDRKVHVYLQPFWDGSGSRLRLQIVSKHWCKTSVKTMIPDFWERRTDGCRMISWQLTDYNVSDWLFVSSNKSFALQSSAQSRGRPSWTTHLSKCPSQCPQISMSVSDHLLLALSCPAETNNN